MSDALPVGWVATTIGKVLQPQVDGKLIHQGWSPQCHAEAAGLNEWGVLKTTAIQDGRFFGFHNKKLPSDKDPKPRIEVKPGDLLITNAGPRIRCGVTTFVPEVRKKLMISGKMYRMRFNETVIFPKYIEFCLRSSEVKKEIDNRKTGISESGLNLTQERFLTVPIKLAPLNEQIRIANKLSSVLAKVDSAQARLEKIHALLRRFRQAVLAAATTGELTRGWRSEPSTKSWKAVRLIDVVVAKPRNGYSPLGVEHETLVRNLTLGAVTKGKFVDGCFKYVDVDVPLDSHLWIKKNDILIQRANSIEYVGVSALYEGEDNQYIYPDLIMKCRASDKILPKYLHYSLLSESTRKYFRENATGTTGNMPKINQVVVSAAPVILPPIEEQQEIVRKVESLFARADAIEDQYTYSRKRVSILSQAILSKAFRGELISQDPNDEPASELLKRIKTEWQNAISEKSAKKVGKIEVVSNGIDSSKKTKARKMKLKDAPERYLLDLLTEIGGEAQAQVLWKKSELKIDDFYAKLKQEMRSKSIIEEKGSRDPSQRKLKVAES